MTAFLVTSIGLVGLGLGWALAPSAGAPLLILAMLLGVFSASGTGDQRYLAATLGCRRGATYRR